MSEGTETPPAEVSAYEAQKSVDGLIKLLAAASAALVVLRDKQALEQTVVSLTRRSEDLRSEGRRLEEQVAAIRASIPVARAEVEAASRVERGRITGDLDRARQELVGLRREREAEQSGRREAEGQHRDRLTAMQQELAARRTEIEAEIDKARRNGAEVRARLAADTERAQAGLDSILAEQAALVSRLQAAGQVAAAPR